MYHPSGPAVLKAVSVQANLSNNFKHLLKCCPEYGDLSTELSRLGLAALPQKSWGSKKPCLQIRMGTVNTESKHRGGISA